MPKTRISTALILASLLGLVLFVWLNWFPPGGEAMEPPADAGQMITRTQAEQVASAFVEARYDQGDWRVFAMFDANAAATGYLSKERPDSDPADVWPDAPLEFFRVEAEDSRSKSRLNVYVSAEQPRVIGWEMVGSEGHGGARHFTSAEAALRDLGYDPNQFTAAVEEGQTVYTHRNSVGQLDFRLEVTLDGDRVEGVVPTVAAPEAVTRLLEDYEMKGLLITLSTLLGSLLLGIGAIVFAAVYRKEMAFHRGIWLTLASFIPLAGYTIGLYPALRATFPFVPAGGLSAILFQQGFNLVNAVILYLSLVAGEGLWRKMGFRLWPDMRDETFGPMVKRSVWLGYLFCFVLLGIQAVLLYIGFERFGVWTTADPMNDGRNQLFLAGYPLLAWTAAISEEGVYRLFAIAALTFLFRPLWRGMHRLTGRPIFLNPLFAIVPAVIISSVLWGAAHVGYTVYPVYTRLIEVTLLGFVFSWVLLRYGLMAAIFAHASVDLIWMGYSLIVVDGNQWLLGLAYMVTPIVAGYLAAWFVSRYKKSPDSSAGNPLST